MTRLGIACGDIDTTDLQCAGKRLRSWVNRVNRVQDRRDCLDLVRVVMLVERQAEVIIEVNMVVSMAEGSGRTAPVHPLV